jgi:hypothetical protein
LATVDELAEAYKSKSVNTFNDIPKSDFEEMETLYNLGGVELINKVLGLELTDFRYGIPIPNINPGFKSIEKLAEEYRPIPKTSVENIFELLEIENDCSYETFEDRIQQKFNFSKLLGDDTFWNSDDGVTLLKSELELNLPLSYLHDKNYMTSVRECFELNLNMPGCLGNSHIRFINNPRIRGSEPVLRIFKTCGRIPSYSNHPDQ